MVALCAAERSDKVLDRSELARFGEGARLRGDTLVWTNGCFDLLHLGHVRSLQAARRLGDVLVVGVNSDASVRLLKGPERPIIPQDDRLETLAALECVSRVVLFDEPTPEQALLLLRPHIHCKGADYAGKVIS